MKAYYFDDVPGDPRLPHTSSTSTLPPSHISSLGLLHTYIPPPASDSEPAPEALDALASARHYSHRDKITVSPDAMGAVYEDKIKMFFDEHMHEDEEIRYILDGAGYFDVRERDDERWVRIRLEKGDLLVLPAGIYHRFTVDENNVSCFRFFAGLYEVGVEVMDPVREWSS